MFPQRELNRLERKKRTIVARNDLLREECGEMWSALGRRTAFVERSWKSLRRVPPSVSLLSAAALLCLKTRYLPGRKYLGPLFAIATLAVDSTRRPSREEPSPDSHRLR